MTSAGFSMTISNTLMISHRKTCWSQSKRWVFDIVMEIFPWLCQTPIAWTDFSRFFHDYQTYPSPRLTSEGFSMTMSSTHLFKWLQLILSWKNLLKSVEAMSVFDIVMGKSAEVSRGDGCVRYCYGKTSWSQASTDFRRFFHDYVKHTPLQMTSAGFSMTISNTLTASTDFSRFFHD
jgi:hypothetical protein